MPQAATRTSSSPGPGRGSARVITSAPKPGLVLARAFMTGASLFQYDLTAPLVKAAVRDETARASTAVAFHERFASATVFLAGPDLGSPKPVAKGSSDGIIGIGSGCGSESGGADKRRLSPNRNR